jgi:hypothetical protein
MVGEVETDFYAQPGQTFLLPAGSHYKEIEEILGKQSRGELQVNNEKAEFTARKIVGTVTTGESGQVWHGGVAGTAKFALAILPTRLFEWALHRNRGIYNIYH